MNGNKKILSYLIGALVIAGPCYCMDYVKGEKDVPQKPLEKVSAKELYQLKAQKEEAEKIEKSAITDRSKNVRAPTKATDNAPEEIANKVNKEELINNVHPAIYREKKAKDDSKKAAQSYKDAEESASLGTKIAAKFIEFKEKAKGALGIGKAPIAGFKNLDAPIRNIQSKLPTPEEAERFKTEAEATKKAAEAEKILVDDLEVKRKEVNDLDAEIKNLNAEKADLTKQLLSIYGKSEELKKAEAQPVGYHQAGVHLETIKAIQDQLEGVKEIKERIEAIDKESATKLTKYAELSATLKATENILRPPTKAEATILSAKKEISTAITALGKAITKLPAKAKSFGLTIQKFANEIQDAIKNKAPSAQIKKLADSFNKAVTSLKKKSAGVPDKIRADVENHAKKLLESVKKIVPAGKTSAKSAKEPAKKAPEKTEATIEKAPALKREKLSAPTSAAQVVKNILGVSEEAFVKMPPEDRAKYLTSEMIDGQKVYFLKDPNNPDAPKVRVGSYTQPTGANLEDRVAKRKAELKDQPRKGTSFSIVYQSANNGLQHIDTGNMQADPAYKDALFMVASNFSGLETVNERDTPTGEAKKISAYVGDKTQGPSAAMSTAAGTVFRTYFANCEKYPNEPSKWPQAVGNKDQETNFLRDLGIETRNGYVTEDGVKNINKLAAPDAFSKFSYGFQEGTQVTHTGASDIKMDAQGRVDGFHQRLNDPEQKVSQMYVAALDVKQGSSPLVAKLKDPNTSEEEKKQIMKAAQSTLEMSYDAIIKEAFARGKTKVVLTRIGGGAFGNSPETIDAAIKNALEKNKDLLEMGGIHVTLNAFGKPNEAMTKLTNQLGGTITEFGNGKKVETTFAGEKVETAVKGQ